MKTLSFDEFKKQREESAAQQQKQQQVSAPAAVQQPVSGGSTQYQESMNNSGTLTFDQFRQARESGTDYDGFLTEAGYPTRETYLQSLGPTQQQTESAKRSLIAYDQGGKVSPWQTALNMAQDAKAYSRARSLATGDETEETIALREERKKLIEERNRTHVSAYDIPAALKRQELQDRIDEIDRQLDERQRSKLPQTAEEASALYGEEMVEVPWMSKLLGRPVFNPAKGAETGADLISFIGNAARMAQGNLTSAEQAELMRQQAETGGRLHEAATSAWEEMRKAPSALKEKLTSLPESTGDETVDNWHKDTRTNAEAARMIAETYGIPTYALEGSATRENTDAYTQRYEDMEFGEKMGANAGMAAAGYGLDITNAALAGWNTLSGGRLGEEGGKASSIFQAANFLQNAGSGLTAQAYSSMRESANWLEKLILDLEKTGVEQVLDRTLGAGNGLVPMGIRVFGSGAQESEDRGEDWKKQAGTGLARAAIELGTEALSGVGGSWRGTGYGESFLNAVDKWVASKTGSELLGTLANAYGGEALEEMIADVLNPLADRIFGIGEATGRGQDHTFMQQLGDFLTDVWGDGQILYDGLLGGLAGAGGGVTAHVGYSAGARNLAVDISTYKAAQRIAGSNSLKAKFEKLTGVKLDADQETATIQLAVYLANVTESSGGTLDARQAETNLFNGKTTGTEKNSATLATTGGRVSDVQGTISSDFKAAGIELHEDESKVLASGFMTGDTDLDTYEEGILEAYKLGQSGKFTLEEAIRGSKYAAVLNESQFRHAWQLGASVQTTENETADIKTEAGRTRVSAALASLGKYADTAVDAYENGQDVSTYAAAMQKAAVLYAANGADLKAAAQEVREGKRADIIGRLTDKQVDAAAQIGQQMRQESDEAARNVGAVYAAIRQQAAAIGAGAAQNTARISAAIRRANTVGSAAMETFKQQRATLEAMVQANPELEGSEEFNRLFDEAKRNMETVQRMQRAVENLKSKQTKAEEEQRRTTEHKAGTVSYEAESGSVGGVQYEAVDRSKLTQTQQAVTRIAEAIARATGLEIHIAKFGDNVGGEYLRGQGGVIWLNIDANYKGANIAVGSLTHEMTHWLQEYAPEEYQQLKRAVLDEMNRDPARFAQIFGERARIQPDLRPSDITDEMTANACQVLFMDEASVQRIVSENRSLGQKILDFFKSILADIKAAFSEIDTSSDFTLYQEVRAAEGAIDQMRDLFVQAMHTATENLQAERTVQQENVRLSEKNARNATAEQEERTAGLDTREQTKVQFQRYVQDEETAQFLKEQEDEGKVIHTYKSFLEIDGKLYPPMASKEKGADGTYRMRNAIEPGRWVESEGNLKNIIIDPKNGRGYFNLKKDDGSTIKAAYNPYQHSSNLMLNDQFTGAYSRPNLVTYECIIPESELTSGYRAEYAKDAVGLHPWKSGPVAGKLAKAKGTERQVYLSRWLKPIRKVPEAEVAQHYKELLDGTDIGVPSNVVPPALLRALEDAGVKIEYDERAPKQSEQMTGKNGKASNSAVSEAASGTENTGKSSKNATPKGGVQYQKYADDSETKSIKQQIREHAADLNRKPVVATVSVSDMPLKGVQKQRTWVENRLRNTGYAVDRKGLGKIEFTPSQINTGLNYLDEPGEIAAFAALPAVLKRGDIINQHDKHKGRERGSITIAGPVVINGVRGNMAVALTQTSKTHYHTHRILMPDNSVFVFDEKYDVEPKPAGELPAKQALIAEPISSTSEDIVTDAAQNSKPQFQMIGEVEETDRLVAVHNKSVSGLKRMLARGGVPFPSIAIKKAGAAHEGFGDVSIVFPRSTIDPAESRWNRLYSNDAWTPTEPRTEYDVGDTWKLQQQMKEEIGDGAYRATKLGSYLEEAQLERDLSVNEGDVVKTLKGRTGIKYAYLKSIGQEPKTAQREKDLDGFGRYKNAQLIAVFNSVPAAELKAMSYDSTETLQKIADALNEQWLSTLPTETAQRLAGKRPLYSADRINPQIIKDALRNYERVGGQMESEIDDSALNEQLQKNTALEEDPKYQEWIRERFGDIIKDSGIPNGKGLYTDAGNRRSFKARHVPATLENIVQQMRKEQEKGIGLGGINLRGAATKAYRGVEDMRKESGKLLGEHVFDEEYDSYMKEFGRRLNDLTEMADSTGYDTAKQTLLEAVRDSKNKPDMARRLQGESRWIKYSDELVDELWTLRNDVQNMPAPYFEAKPRRIVYPEEALAYILPDNADSSVIKALENKGYNVLTYKAGDEQDRLAKLNSVEGAQFQRWDDTTDDTAAERNGRELAYARLQSENAILSETVAALRKLTDRQNNTIEKLQKRLQLTKTPEVRENDARKLARQLLAEHGSRADVGSVAAKLKTVGDYILQTPTAEIDEATLKAKARAAAMEILNNAYDQTSLADETYKQIAGEIKGKKLSIDEDFLGELDEAGGYEKFRKSMFGSFTLAKRESHTAETREGYATVDQFYTDLQSEYGKGFFPDVANEGEQVQILAKMLEAGQPIEVNPYAQYMGEASEELANRIVMDAMSGVLRQNPPTAADKQKARRVEMQERILALKAENKLEQREAARLYQTIYDLSVSLDKAESKYETLRQEANYRTAQVRAEGAARAAEIKASERARAAKQISALKEHYHDMAQHARERREESAGVSKYRKQVEKKAKALYEMLLTNSNDKHVPEVLKAPLGEFLESLDFSSKRKLAGGAETQNDMKLGARLQKLQQMLENQQKYINGEGNIKEDLGGYIDVAPDVLDYLRGMSEQITETMNAGGVFTINQMSAEDLKGLSKLLSNLTAAIKNMNSFMANARYERVADAARADIQNMNRMGRASAGENGKLFSTAFWENGTPYYIMKRFGEGGRAIFDGLTRGWEKMAFNVQEVIRFADDAYDTKEVNEWKAKTHEITLESGQKITMTTAQIMELSMLLGREQAVKHISKGGIRIGDIETKGGTVHDTTHYHLTAADITAITGLLTERQAAVAKALQRYMAVKGAEWGNEITMRRFGYNFYEEGPDYYPIRTDQNDRPMADTDMQQNSMFRLLNLSSSKALNPKASNALIVGDIFDTFADHMSDMAKLNGMGLPILDAIKWFNYKERINYDDGTYDTVTLQGTMEQAFGTAAQKYFRTLIKDVNGVRESGDRGTAWYNKLMSNYKAAAVAANLRVAFLQPTSYVRATYILKPQHMAGVLPSKAAYQEMMKYSGTGNWKDIGGVDTNLARGMREQIEHNSSWKDRLVEKSMALAEMGDQATWSRLWQACKRQIKAENRGLSGEALNRATADLFREVVYATQVMDSTLTRSELMRGSSNATKAMTAFMAEPTLSYNLLMDAASEYRLDVRKNGKHGALSRNSGKLGKSFAVYVCSAAFSAVVESVFDAMRDDDDYESFMLKWAQAMFGEGNLLQGNLLQDLTILGKLPFAKNFISTLQGYKSGDMGLSAFNTAIDAVKIWEETLALNLTYLPEPVQKAANFFGIEALDKPTKTTYYGNMTEWGKIYKTLQALSQLSGIGVSNAARDVIAIFNSTVGAVDPARKIKTYDPGQQKSIKDAFGSGAFSEEEAISKLVETGEAKNADAAYWIVRGWAGEDKYTEIKTAAFAGDGTAFKSEMQQLTAHGVKEKDVYSAIKSTIKKAYLGEDLNESEARIVGDTQLTDEQARRMLKAYAGMSVDDSVKLVADWRSAKTFVQKHGDEYEKYGLSMAQAQFYYSDAKSGSLSIERYAEQVEKYGYDRIKAYYGADGWGSTGLSIEQYDTYATKAAECKGTDNDGDGETDANSVKNQVLLVINALPVSSAVKDAIYRKRGWSERNLTKAPWH